MPRTHTCPVGTRYTMTAGGQLEITTTYDAILLQEDIISTTPRRHSVQTFEARCGRSVHYVTSVVTDGKAWHWNHENTRRDAMENHSELLRLHRETSRDHQHFDEPTWYAEEA